MQNIEIVKGDNGTINLKLETAAEEIKEEIVEEEIVEEEIKEEVAGPVKVSEIPKTYTSSQEWALKEAFKKIYDLTVGKEVMSEKERIELMNSFAMYSNEQKIVLDLLWIDVEFYTRGALDIGADEFIMLKEKYRMI